MATKQDVVDAYYEGVCTVLMSSNVLGSVNIGKLEIDCEEFRAWLQCNGSYPQILAWLNE